MTRYSSDYIELPEVEFDEDFSGEVVVYCGPSKERLLKALAAPTQLDESTVALGLKLKGQVFFGPSGNKYYHGFKVASMKMADDIGDKWFIEFIRIKDGSRWLAEYCTVTYRTHDEGPFLTLVSES